MCHSASPFESRMVQYSDLHWQVNACDQLEKLSFLRAVDSSLDPKSREYYFIHLTFQEYFAAQYFVRHWKEKEPLVSVIFGTQHPVQVSPDQFVECEKYNRHYHVMWRFVTGLLQTECESVLYPFLQTNGSYLTWIIRLKIRKRLKSSPIKKSLPLDILKTSVLHLESSTIETRHAAEKALRHKSFHSLLPHLSAEEWVSWLKVLRERNFKESITCFVTEGNLCVEIPGVSSEINIRDCDQREKLQRALKVLDERNGEVA
ncbi:uncharacterized protein ASPGLDRAFT_1496714 [Aspergillus glaucus CBS 516.65]|uniref:NACHT LRR and PYD domain-containing protein n=1 Tax=Aspergillus glaucus CBS 516.65 TaxID=1160497 RepID=A0A1L9VE86_ASPGL|nr:hypothetical protein ASPGLDRAFT_1496714 [Aspergillus glaucus CBS 516.65]OJJ82230.1 hypothetical protein ASPGLDRAFT_1496714 [Aspergillus glaucus CBS 516.65]